MTDGKEVGGVPEGLEDRPRQAGRIQAKDIPDLPVLQFMAKVKREGVTIPYSGADDGRTLVATWVCSFKGSAIGVGNGMPPGVGQKLILAKMRSMIKRGLVTGCACGCRGDFELTDAGREILQ